MKNITSEYTIVDKNDIPDGGHKGGIKYRPIFDNLPDDKAMEFIYDTKQEATDRRINILACMGYYKLDYRIRTRVIPDGDKFILYAWKEKKVAEVK